MYIVCNASKQVGDYRIDTNKPLGQGSFGKVYRGCNIKTNEQVAVKAISKQKIKDVRLKDAIINEIQVMKNINSNFVVRLLDFWQTPNNYYLMQQLCDSNLSSIMKKGQSLPEAKCIQLLAQICKGFIPLIEKGIAHRDLKPDNILMKGGICKIADFGFSKTLRSDQLSYKTHAGTPKYMSVEILKSESYTNKCDIWSLGLIFYQLLHGFHPWKANKDYELIKELQSCEKLQIHRSNLSPHTIDFLCSTLAIKEADRLSWSKLYEHPIFNGSVLYEKDQFFQTKKNHSLKLLMIGLKKQQKRLRQILKEYHLSSQESQLTFEKFFCFLRQINNTIFEEDASFLFRLAAKTKQQTISFNQIKQLLKLPYKKTCNTSILQCFNNLGHIMLYIQCSLEDIFCLAEKSRKGYLTLEQFECMLKELNHNVCQQNILPVFKQIAKEKKQMYLEQFQRYYYKITGTSEICQLRSTVSNLLQNFNQKPSNNSSNEKDSFLMRNQLPSFKNLPCPKKNLQ